MSALEAAVTVVLISGFAGVATLYHRQLLRRSKELALKAQLKNLRASLEFFEATRRRRPASLAELVRESMNPARGGGIPRRLPEPTPEQLEDAFGGRYAYDPSAGTIQSQTSGYELW